MADIARVVDEVRGFLLSYDQSLNDKVPELANEYAALCIEANKRLAKCQRLLQQGLRGEAIHLAQEAPDLLDTIQGLDFPDRAAWLEVAKQYSLTIPPDFDATAIEFLQSAFVEDSPLRDLMRTHRRLALVRAPLRQRIEVLRKLAEKDANNPIWAADVQAFESARLDQIKDEAADARRRQDVAALGLINDELCANTWTAPPPKGLTRAVTQALADFRHHQTRQDQAELVWAMQEAFAALDEDRAREIRTRWQAIDGRSGERSINPLYSQVEPAFLWLEEIDRQVEEENLYHEALAELSDGLANRLPRPALEALGEGVFRFGRGMPEDLERRYRARVDELIHAADRKRKLLIACVVAAVAILSLLGLAITWQMSQAVAAREAAARIDRALAASKPEEARDIRDALALSRPMQARHPAVIAATARLVAAEEAEASRATRFEEALREADASPPEAEESPRFEIARSRARTEAERRKVRDAATRHREAYLALVASNDERVRPGLDAASAKLAEVRRKLDDPAEADAIRSLLREITTDLNAAAPLVADAGEASKSDHQSLATRADEVRAELHRRDLWKALEDRLTRATMRSPSTADDFGAGLAEAIRFLPEPRASDFRKALGEKAAWAGALAWAELCHAWQLAPAGSESSSVARTRAGQCARLLEAHPRYPDRGLAEATRARYEAIARRTLGEPSLRKKINDLFSDPLIEDIYLSQVREGPDLLDYYSKQPIKRLTRELHYFFGFRESESRNTYPQAKDVEFEGKSPQSLLASELKAALARDPALEGWDSLMILLASRIGDHQGTDPLIKVSLLRFLLPMAGEGSRDLARALEPSLKILESAKALSNVRWMDPKDPSGRSSREEARKLLKSLPPWDEVKRSTEANRVESAGLLEGVPQPIGWLARDAGWSARTPVASIVPPAGKLLVVALGPSTASWKAVGQIRDGRMAIEAAGGEPPVEGSLLFVRAEKVRP